MNPSYQIALKNSRVISGKFLLTVNHRCSFGLHRRETRFHGPASSQRRNASGFQVPRPGGRPKNTTEPEPPVVETRLPNMSGAKHWQYTTGNSKQKWNMASTGRVTTFLHKERSFHGVRLGQSRACVQQAPSAKEHVSQLLQLRRITSEHNPVSAATHSQRISIRIVSVVGTANMPTSNDSFNV